MAYYPNSYPSQGNSHGPSPYQGYSSGRPPVTSQPGGGGGGGYYPSYPGPAKPSPNDYPPQDRGYRQDDRLEDPYSRRKPEQQPYKDPRPKILGIKAGENGREWSSGICDCTQDVRSCMCTWCCSPCYEMYSADEFGENCWNWTPCCLGVLGSTLVMRHRMRERENIKGSLLKDCVATLCCPPCTYCQLKRENDIILRDQMQGPPGMDSRGPPPQGFDPRGQPPPGMGRY